MGLSRTVSEINGDFSQKSQIFRTPVYFAPPINGFLLEFGIGAGMFKATGWRKKFDDIFSHVDTIHQRDRQTDGRTYTGRQQIPRLRIASCGKNLVPRHCSAMSLNTRNRNQAATER